MVVTKRTREKGRGTGDASARIACRLAWSLCAVCVVLIALALLLDFLTDESVLVFLPDQRLDPGLAVLAGVLSLACATVGALIVSRLPTNLIGWLFCGVGLLYAVRRVSEIYCDYALLENIALPGGEYAAWFSSLVGPAGLTLAGVFLMLLFPEGRLPSGRLRIVAWVALCGATLSALVNAFVPGPLPTHYYVANPFGVAAGIGLGLTTYDLFLVSIILGNALLITSTLAALLSLLVRLRRARGDERQQLKWFLYAAVPAAVCVSLVLFRGMVYNFTSEFMFNTESKLPWHLFNAILYVAVFALLLAPFSPFFPIWSPRLFDIDLVINRTLVYGALTACIV